MRGPRGRGPTPSDGAGDAEKKIQNEILEALGGRTDLRVWRANNGVARSMDFKRVVKYGVAGQGDVSGIIAGGIRLEIEVKTARGVQSAQQVLFMEMIRRFGGVYLVCRSAAEAVAFVNMVIERDPRARTKPAQG